MSSIYTSAHRNIQNQFKTIELADQIEAAVVESELSESQTNFIESQSMFFLSTIDEKGRPTVSYKGGNPGFVRALNKQSMTFPSYDGNGMFFSMGNISANPEVGLLFVDFATPNRLRVQGRAKLVDAGPLLDSYPGADLVVNLEVTQVWVNCSRYVHKMARDETSPYVPNSDGLAPIALWKRIEGLDQFLSIEDKEAVDAAGRITQEEYERKLLNGETT